MCWSRLKRFCPSPATIGLGYFLGGKLGQSLATAVFNAISAVTYTLNIDIDNTDQSDIVKNPVVLAVAGAAVLAAGYICIRSRWPSMIYKWNQKKETESCARCSGTCRCIVSTRDCAATFVSGSTKVSSSSSLMFVTMNTCLFLYKSSNFIALACRADPASQTFTYIIIPIVELGFGIPNGFSYYSFNKHEADETGEELAEMIRNGQIKIDRNARISIGVFSITSVQTMTFAFYTTHKTLDLIPVVKNFPELIKIILSAIASVPAVSTNLMTNFKPFLQLVNDWTSSEEEESKLSRYAETQRYQSTWDVTLANIVDSLIANISGVAGFAFFCKKVLGLDPYSLSVYSTGGFFCFFSLLLNFALSRYGVEKGTRRTQIQLANRSYHYLLEQFQNEILAPDRKDLPPPTVGYDGNSNLFPNSQRKELTAQLLEIRTPTLAS